MSDDNKRIGVKNTLNESTGTLFPIQFVQVGDLSDVPAPLVRISTCGGMRVEVLHEILNTNPPQGRYVIVTPQQRRRGSTTGCNLLSALVSLPGHYAAKSWLAERLCRYKSEVDEDDAWSGMVRVDNIVTLLRGLLCPPGIAGEKELRKVLVSYVLNRFESGSGYQLAGEPLLWLDVDVIEASVKEACVLEQQGQDALPMWERAYALASRGGYLLDERYSDWAESKRREVEGYQRQAVHALHRLYLAHKGEAAEEQVLLLLRSYWQVHPTDEDVLRPLLEVLGKRGCAQEAEEYYNHLCQELELEGLMPHPSTQQTIKNVRNGQTTTHRVETNLPLQATSDYSFDHQDETQTSFSRGIIESIMKIIPELEGTGNLKFSDTMHRRAVLAHLFGILPAFLATDKYIADTVSDAMKLQEEALSSLYEDMLIMGWDSFRRSKSPQIIIKIDEHVNKLNALARSASMSDATQWQSLLCRFSQLSTRIAQHRLDEPRALSMAKQAIMLAIDLDDTELIASTFYGRGRVYMEYSNTAIDIRQKKRYFDRAKADIDAALGHVGRVRAPLAGNIYLLAAEIYALVAGNDMVLRMQCERWQDEVASFLGDSDKIEDDGTFLKLNPTALHHERAKTLLRFGKIEEARNELDTAWKTLQPNLFTWHMNMHLTQATLFLTEHNIEESAKSSLKAHTLAKTIYSQKGEIEVQRLLGHLQQLDKANSSVRELTTTIGGNR